MKVFNNKTYERDVLSCLLKDPELVDSLRITEEHLDFKEHKKILKGIIDLNREGKAIDFKNLGEKVGMSYTEFFDIQGSAPSLQVFESMENSIIELHQKSALQKLLFRSLEELHSGKSVEEINASIDSFNFDLEKNDDKGRPVEDVMYDALKVTEEAIIVKGKITGMESGFKQLDETLNGFEKGKYVIIGARPGVGKTAFALEIARRLSEKNNVAFFSIEMTSTELGQRLLSNQSLIPMSNLKKGKIKPSTFETILRHSDEISRKKLIVNDDEDMTVEKLVKLSKYYKKSYGLDAIVVDYITLLETTSKFTREVDKVTYISKQLRKLAKTLGITVICLSQLNRNVESRGSNEPMLSDIKECGSIEQDANVVLLLYTEEKEKMEQEMKAFDKNTLFVKVAKNRGGEAPIQPIYFDYFKKTQRIEER